MYSLKGASFEVLTQRYGSRYKWLLLMVVGIGTVAGVLATSSFNVAMTALSRDYCDAARPLAFGSPGVSPSVFGDDDHSGGGQYCGQFGG